MQQEQGLVMFCDLHGHSRKNNIFAYGCQRNEQPTACVMFPYMLSKLNPFFSFKHSRFGIQKSKTSTARVALFKELRTCDVIYTLESAFSGVDFGEHKGYHLSTEMLQRMGQDLCRTLLIYEKIHIPKEV